jgi:hydroxymethylglutaryl-CoA lyase/(R)-citramalyl-CoA lyase
VAETLRVVGAAHRAGRRVAVTLAAAFGCPFEGGVDPERVVDLAVEVAQAVPDEIVLADTIGVATPWHVRRLVTAVDRAVSFPVGVHLHNTRNTGYANAYAAIEAGAVTLDASIGGIGGCPFAPNATGNIATEDLLNMLQAEGVETGVDLDEVIRTAEWVERLLGRQVPGHLSRAGRFDVATRQV